MVGKLVRGHLNAITPHPRATVRPNPAILMKKGDLISSNVYTGMFPDVDIEMGQKARLLETPRERNKDTDIAWIELVGGPHDGHQGEISPLASDWEYAEPRNISEKNI